MPLPENSRLTFYKFMPETPTDHYANNREIDRWAANLPFFRQRTKVLRSVGSGGSVNFTTVTPNWGYLPYTTGVQIAGFKKFESWTSVNVRVGSQFAITNNRTIDIGVRFSGSAIDPSTGFPIVIKNYWINQMFSSSSSVHSTLDGEITIDGYSTVPLPADADQTYYPSTAYSLKATLPADTYRVDLIGRVQSGATATFDQYDNCFLSIIETY
jgi:hypothetical protein